MRSFHCALVLAAVVSYPDVASACSCAPSKLPCGSLTGSVVFIGTVEARSDGRSQGGAGFPRADDYVFELAVVEAFAGITSPRVTIHTAADTAACGYPFEIGESYLVYAHKGSDDVYYAGLCSRTRRLANADDDLVLLRQAAKGQTSSRVFGAVVRSEPEVAGRFAYSETFRPMPGVPVVARNEDFSVETATDGEGRFVFDGLPPGEYRIEPRWPAGLKSTFQSDPVAVGPCGAGDIVFFAVTDAPLWGTVHRSDGTAVGKNVAVTIIRTDPADPRGERAEERSTREYTDERGRYAFDGLSAGRYIVGVNILDPPSLSSPYPAIYHPSGTDIAGAVPVEVIDGRQVRVDVRLAPPLRTRRISGVVVDEHDTPVADASISLSDVLRPHRFSTTTHGRSDSAGHFDIEGIEGRQYELRGVSYRPDREATLAVSQRSGNVAGLKLVLRP